MRSATLFIGLVALLLPGTGFGQSPKVVLIIHGGAGIMSAASLERN